MPFEYMVDTGPLQIPFVLMTSGSPYMIWYDDHVGMDSDSEETNGK